MNYCIQEVELEKLETLIAIQEQSTYKAYNSLIRSLKRHCLKYLHILDSGSYDDEGGTTKLDRHRVNLCRQEFETILKMIKVNGELINNNYLKIAVIHAYKYLHRIKQLCEDVSIIKVKYSITT